MSALVEPNFEIERTEILVELGHVPPHRVTVIFEHSLPLAAGVRSLANEIGIASNLVDRQSGRPKPGEEGKERYILGGVATVAAFVTGDRRQEPGPLVVPQGMHGKSGSFRNLLDRQRFRRFHHRQ